MRAQTLALLTSIFYATTLVSARRGLKYSTPLTVTSVSVLVQNVLLWTAVFLTGGIPSVAPTALWLFALVGVTQFCVRMFSYTGVDKIGAARSSALQSVSPIVSTIIAIIFLHERPHAGVLVGTALVVGGIALLSGRAKRHIAGFRWWHLLLPLAAAGLTGTNQPIRRYALSVSSEPLFFAAVMGGVSLLCLFLYLAFFPSKRRRLVCTHEALGPFLLTGLAETLSIIFIITALSVGTVSVIAPIATTYPLWSMIGAAIFLRDAEKITPMTVLGTLSVVAGTTAVLLFS
ncbi:MAG TPA: DMT family transporter [Candidatus Binatia bacterium]|jgi:drug/metabolite transporter (DMT)-like permease